MFVYYIVIILLVAADLATKSMIAANPAYSDMTVIPGFFHITYVENTGAAWSILSGQRILLSLIAGVAVVVMLGLMHKSAEKGEKLAAWALALMSAGALGNLIDRLMLGHVRDFLNFYIFGYDFPVFNVADVCLTIGVCLLILSSLIEPGGKGEQHG